jgi:hypothetical protein
MAASADFHIPRKLIFCAAQAGRSARRRLCGSARGQAFVTKASSRLPTVVIIR